MATKTFYEISFVLEYTSEESEEIVRAKAEAWVRVLRALNLAYEVRIESQPAE